MQNIGFQRFNLEIITFYLKIFYGHNSMDTCHFVHCFYTAWRGIRDIFLYEGASININQSARMLLRTSLRRLMYMRYE